MEFIRLHEHDGNWKALFSKERKLIINTLGLTANKIHHVGSTAVPDLLAKSIVDIAIESNTFPPTQLIIDKLKSIDYEYRGDSGIPGRFWFTKGQPRKFNLHYCKISSEIVKNQITFRNKLTKNGHFRREYEELKFKNLTGNDIDSSEYALAKSELIKKIIDSDNNKNADLMLT